MLSALFDNPVVTKELRGRMRGARTYWLLFGYVLLLSLILFFSYLGWWAQHSADMATGGSAAGFTVGRTFFKILFYSQAVMMALITPALTAGAITVEREQRTFEMLRGTILRPGAIVWGKLSSSVSFVALLLTSSLPLLSLCFLLGGVSPGEVFFAYLLLIGDAFLFGAIGLCWSAYAGGTATATVLSYGTLIVFFAATIPFAIPALLENAYTTNFGLCAVNPLGAVTGAVMPEHYYGWILPAWVPALLLNGTLTWLLVLAAINRLEDFPAQRAAALRGVMLLFAGLLIFFGDGLMAAPMGNGLTGAWSLAADMMLACGLILLFVPVLVTGDLEQAPARKNAGKNWSLLRVFTDARLSSGLPLALLLTALVAVLTFAGGQYAPLLHGASVFTAPGGTLILQVAVMLLAIVVGISGFGFLLSALLRNRWSSLTLLYLALIFAVALPYFSYANLYGRDAAAAAQNPLINSLYLCPLVAIRQMTSLLYQRPSFEQDSALSGMIGYDAGPLWVGTSLVYLTIGLVSYTLGLMVLRRQKLMRSA
jgi:hypothetical protein